MDPMIRPAEARDVDALSALMAQLLGYAVTADQMRDRLAFVDSSPIDWLYVCEVGGQVRGVMGFRLREHIERPGCYGEISVLVTHADARRQGVGRALTAFAEQLARDHGCEGMFLVSGFKRQDEAHRFYETLGYTATGYRFIKKFEA